MEIEKRSKFTIQAANELIDAIGFDNENTATDYKIRIPLYLDFIEQHGMNYRVLIDYKKWLASKNDWKTGTKQKYFIAAKKLSKVLYETKQIPVDITKNIAGESIKGFSVAKVHKKNGVSEKEAWDLAQYLHELPDTPKNNRVRAILSLFIYQGLRQIEVSRLMVEDVDLEDRILFVQGKGEDDKEPVELLDKTIKHLENYMSDYKLKSGPLFPSETTSTVGRNLSTRRIREIVKETFRAAGVSEKRSTHGLRHHFTTVLDEQFDHDVNKIMRYSRHKDPRTVMMYIDSRKKAEDRPDFERAFDGLKF